MSIQIRQAGRIATEVTLSFYELELLVAAAHENGLKFTMDPFHDEGFRYFLRDEAHALVLQSMDVSDLARCLGLTQPFAEAGVTPDTGAPTQFAVHGRVQLGPVPLQARQRATVQAGADLPRNEAGQIDHQSPAFMVRRCALALKSGYGMLDCNKALRFKDGNATEALALLVSTDGFAYSKI
jgi:hypothetical protein